VPARISNARHRAAHRLIGGSAFQSTATAQVFVVNSGEITRVSFQTLGGAYSSKTISMSFFIKKVPRIGKCDTVSLENHNRFTGVTNQLRWQWGSACWELVNSNGGQVSPAALSPADDQLQKSRPVVIRRLGKPTVMGRHGASVHRGRGVRAPIDLSPVTRRAADSVGLTGVPRHQTCSSHPGHQRHHQVDDQAVLKPGPLR